MGSTKEKAPKTYSLRATENALQNIDNITGYIAYIKHQPINAIHVGDKIFETFDRIEKNPFSFRECEEIPTKTKIYRKAVIAVRTANSVCRSVTLRLARGHLDGWS